MAKHFNRREFRRVPFGDIGNVTYPARVREEYAQDLLSTVEAKAIRRPQLPHRRRLRLLGLLVRPAARARAARARGGLRARVHHRVGGDRVVPAGVDRAGQAARRPRSAPSSGRCSTAPASGCSSSTSRAARSRSEQTLLLFLRLIGEAGWTGKVAVPVTVTSRVEDDRRAVRPRGRPHARRPRRADARPRSPRRSSSRRRPEASTSSRSSCRATTRSRASARCSSCSPGSSGRSPSSSPSCPPPASSTARSPARGR